MSAFDEPVSLGQSPLFSGAPLNMAEGIASPFDAGQSGIIPSARPPSLWPVVNTPQLGAAQVNQLNVTAPITADTRPFIPGTNVDDTTGLSGFAAILGGINGG